MCHGKESHKASPKILKAIFSVSYRNFLSGESFQDKDAIKLIELFFDKYHFKDNDLQFTDTTQEKNFYKTIEVCQQDLATTPQDELLKVMAAIYRSIQRRTNGNREYLQFVQQYVGVRVAPGVRVITGY